MLVRKKQKKSVPYIGPRAQKETDEMIRLNDFREAKAVHFLVLQDKIHTQFYGVPDPDLCGGTEGIRKQVQGMIDSIGIDGLLDFVRWAWRDEERAEAWRRANHRDGPHLSATRLFSRSKLTEYRISLARRGAKKG